MLLKFVGKNFFNVKIFYKEMRKELELFWFYSIIYFIITDLTLEVHLNGNNGLYHPSFSVKIISETVEFEIICF